MKIYNRIKMLLFTIAITCLVSISVTLAAPNRDFVKEWVEAGEKSDKDLQEFISNLAPQDLLSFGEELGKWAANKSALEVEGIGYSFMAILHYYAEKTKGNIEIEMLGDIAQNKLKNPVFRKWILHWYEEADYEKMPNFIRYFNKNAEERLIGLMQRIISDKTDNYVVRAKAIMVLGEIINLSWDDKNSCQWPENKRDLLRSTTPVFLEQVLSIVTDPTQPYRVLQAANFPLSILNHLPVDKKLSEKIEITYQNAFKNRDAYPIEYQTNLAAIMIYTYKKMELEPEIKEIREKIIKGIENGKDLKNLLTTIDRVLYFLQKQKQSSKP